MSETIKSTDQVRKSNDSAATASQAAVNANGAAARETIAKTANMSGQMADQAAQATQRMTETAKEAANAATTLSAKAADQGRDVLLMGVRTAAGVSGQVADINYTKSHNLLASAVKAMDIYSSTAERSAERVQALMSSCMTFGRGVQKMQHAWLELLDQSMQTATHKPQDLLRCKNLIEVAEVQRDLYLSAVNNAFSSSSRMLEMAGRTAQEAVRPLDAHHQ